MDMSNNLPRSTKTSSPTLNTRGLLTLPIGVPSQRGHYKYEFNHGVYKGSPGFECCSWGNLTKGTLSRPNIVITNIFMDRS